MKARYALVTVAILFACIAAKSEDTYVLNWKPKEGQKLDYVVSMDAVAEGDKSTLLLDVDMKVTKVAANGDYTVETLEHNGRVVAGGEEHKLPEQPDQK